MKNLVKPLVCSLERHPRGNLMQEYGENVELYKKYANGMLGHNGIDIATAYGYPVFATHEGFIVEARLGGSGYGNDVRVLSEKQTDGTYIETIYGHLTEVLPVSLGQYVMAGDTIGYEGNSGFTVSGGVPYWGFSNPDKKGTHLHFGLRILEDATNISNISYFTKDYIIRDYENGRFGYVDPMPYFVTEKGMLTKEQVELFYDIEALPKDDSGRTYWVGKPVEEMLKARKNDLKSFLAS